MAGYVQSVNTFAAPGYDYSTDVAKIERARRLAEALQGQSMEAIPQQTAGGYVVRTSPTQGLAKLAQALVGTRMQTDADQQQRDLAAKSQSDYADMTTRFSKALTGTAAVPAQAPATPNDDEGNVNPMVSATAAKAPDPMGAMAIATAHPMGAPLAGLALDQAKMEMVRQRLKDALAPVTPGQALSTEATAGGAAGPTNAAAGRVGLTAGGLNVDPITQKLLIASGDPAALTKLAEMQQAAYAEENKPQIDRGYGIKKWDPASRTYKLASDPADITKVEQAKLAATQPYEPPISLPLSGGQSVSLSRPEYADYQRTGQLPARYGQGSPATTGAPPAPNSTQGAVPNASLPTNQQGAITAIPANEVDQARAAGVRVNNGPQAAPQQGNLGTPGLTQSQPDVINQRRQEAGGKALDEQFAKDYASFIQGGSSDFAKQLAQLNDVVTVLQDPAKQPDGPITGSIRGYFPDFVRNTSNPQAVAMRERVEEVVQRSLRAVLGAQFTENEGKRLIERAYNEHQDPTENAVRVQRLMTQLKQAFAQKQEAARYFEQNGTLMGFTGKMPALADFEPNPGRMVSGKIGAQAVLDQADAILKGK